LRDEPDILPMMEQLKPVGLEMARQVLALAMTMGPRCIPE
jgi:hypothetical protein